MSQALQSFHIYGSQQTIPAEEATTHEKPIKNDIKKKLLRPEVAFYRKYTEAMMRRYARLSFRVGRMPALLGHDILRGKMSTYRISSFEDSVIFVCDVEKCLKRLDSFSQQLVRRICIQEYTQSETAELIGVSLRTIVRRYGEAIDELTRLLLEYCILDIDRMGY